MNCSESLGLGFLLSSSSVGSGADSSFNDATVLLCGLFIDLATSLDDLLELLITISDGFEELGVDLSEHGCLLGGNLVLIDLLLDGLLQLFGLALGSVEVLLSSHLTLEDCAHDFLLTGVQSVIIEGSAHAHHGDSTVAITNSSHGAVDLDGGEHGVGDLLGVGDLVLAVEEVPNVKETVHTGEEEETWAGRGPATIGQIGLMVTSHHDGMGFEIFAPDLSGPITNSKEVFEMTGVSLNVIDGTVMLALIQTEFQVDFDLLTLVSLEDVTLLGTDKVLEGRSIGVVLETGTTEHLGDGLAVDSEVLDKLELLSGLVELSLIPPKKAAISGC